MKTKAARHNLLWLTLLTAAVQIGFAQNAEITGQITDSTGAVIAGASVTVTNDDTGIQYKTSSNDEGYYTVPLLKPGTYHIGVQSENFRPVARTGIKLDVGRVARIDFQLEVGAVTETIEVSGAAPLIETEATSLGQVTDGVFGVHVGDVRT